MNWSSRGILATSTEVAMGTDHRASGGPEIVRHSGERRNSSKPLVILRGVPKRPVCDLEAATVVDRAVADTAMTNKQAGDELGVDEKVVRLLRTGRLAFSLGRLTQAGEPLYVAIWQGIEVLRARLHAPAAPLAPAAALALALQRLGELQVVLALALPEIATGRVRRDTRENITAAALQFQLAYRALLVAVEPEPPRAGGAT